MNMKLMCLMVASCAVVMTAGAQQEGAPKEGAPKVAPPRPREHGRSMMIEGRDGGDAMLMRALSPESPMAKKLELSKEQIEALKKALMISSEELKAVQGKMEVAGRKQAEMMSESTLNEVAILKGVEEIGALRTEVAKITTKRILAAHNVLTVEQREKLRDMMKARMSEMRAPRKEMKASGDAGEKKPLPPEAPVPAPTPAPAPAAAN